jgi:hypothetical protein
VLTLPGTATYTSPADTATDVNLSVDLVWTASNGSVSSYMVYFGTTNPPTALVQNDLQTSYTPDQLLYNQQYFWQVVTNNTSGVTEGPIWSFTTIDRIIVPLDPVVTDLGDVSPIVTIPDVTGEGSAIVTVTWAPVITGFTEVGLQFIITPTTITLPGRNIIITHNLGYSPVQIAYRILPATSWNMLQPTDPIVTSWNTTEISFTLPAAKADGDLEVIFPPTDGGTLAVELSTFTAIATGNNTMVRLDWTVQSETDHLGYDVLRSDSELVSTAVRVNSAIISNGTANGTLREYSFTDTEIISSNVYYYWLLSINLDGSSQFHGPVMVDMTIPGEEPPSPDIPQLTCLHDAYPNPFNPQTRISYSLKQPERVKIDIFSIKGTLVYTYEATHAMCGTYALSWNGCDRQGRSVASGMYYYRFTAGKYSQTKKMMLVK